MIVAVVVSFDWVRDRVLAISFHFLVSFSPPPPLIDTGLISVSRSVWWWWLCLIINRGYGGDLESAGWVGAESCIVSVRVSHKSCRCQVRCGREWVSTAWLGCVGCVL